LEFSLLREEGGETVKNHISNLKDRFETFKIEKIETPTLPPLAKYSYDCFKDLSRTRRYLDGNKLPIQFTEIKAYMDLYKMELESFEIQLIQIFDNIYLNNSK